MTRSIRLAARFLVVIAIAGAMLYMAMPTQSVDYPYASSLNIVSEAHAAPCRICDQSSGKWRCVNSTLGGACKVTTSGAGCRYTFNC